MLTKYRSTLFNLNKLFLNNLYQLNICQFLLKSPTISTENKKSVVKYKIYHNTKNQFKPIKSQYIVFY